VDTGVASSIKAAASHLEQLGSLVEEVCCSLFHKVIIISIFLLFYGRSLKKKITDFLSFILFQVSLPSFSLGLPAYYILASSEASSNLSRYDGIR
jgi:aspartyl-tRNA(Asn)/glutamyl-tRNA(Gln) amidotransferase subunit A